MADEQPEREADQPAAEGADAAAETAETEVPVAPPEPHPLVTAILARFPSGVEVEGEDTAGNPIVRVGVDSMIEVLTWLRDDESTKFEYLADQTVIDWTERSPRFDVVYHLYSIGKNHFTTVKVGCSDGEGVPTVCDIWGTANWSERVA